MRVNYNSFHNWTKVKDLSFKLKPRSFNTFIMLYMLNCFIYKRSSIHKKVKRTFVILRSPFHYKTPKHHIQYKYYVISHDIIFKKKYFKAILNVMSNFFVQTKTHRVKCFMPKNLKLSDLL